MSGAVAGLIALITAVAAIVTAIGGVLLAIRTVRNRERIALTKERHQLENELEKEHGARVAAELRSYEAEVLLAQHGLAPPPPRKALEPQKAIEQETSDKPD